jgi:large subunit ribosomal protein L3
MGRIFCFKYTMKFLLGKKQYMTTVYTEDGAAHAATVLVAAPSTVTQVKTKEKDGYSAIQLGFDEVAERKVNKPQLAHGKGKAFRTFREFRDGTDMQAEVGSALDVSVFAVGDIISVSGITKGKGFQGGVKRHGFKGGSRTHGQKHSEREPGSIGGGGRAGGRVVKGMRMAGRMGADRITVKNLTVLQVLPETGELVVKGAIPGRRGTLIEIIG